MVLCNYERRTGETLSQDDLHDKKLSTKLLPEDYDFKSQVFPLSIKYLLIHSRSPMNFKCMNNILQVTPAKTGNRLSSTYVEGFLCAPPSSHPLAVLHCTNLCTDGGSKEGTYLWLTKGFPGPQSVDSQNSTSG